MGTPGATPLFTVADQTKLRIYVRVPQTYAGDVHARHDVALHGAGICRAGTSPPRWWPAPARWPAPAAPSLLQFQVDNSDGLIKPGDYAEVHFPLPAGSGVGACAGHRA